MQLLTASLADEVAARTPRYHPGLRKARNQTRLMTCFFSPREGKIKQSHEGRMGHLPKGSKG